MKPVTTLAAEWERVGPAILENWTEVDARTRQDWMAIYYFGAKVTLNMLALGVDPETLDAECAGFVQAPRL